jgi:hypothetical protein
LEIFYKYFEYLRKTRIMCKVTKAKRAARPIKNSIRRSALSFDIPKQIKPARPRLSKWAKAKKMHPRRSPLCQEWKTPIFFVQNAKNTIYGIFLLTPHKIWCIINIRNYLEKAKKPKKELVFSFWQVPFCLAAHRKIRSGERLFFRPFFRL